MSWKSSARREKKNFSPPLTPTWPELPSLLSKWNDLKRAPQSVTHSLLHTIQPPLSKRVRAVVARPLAVVRAVMQVRVKILLVNWALWKLRIISCYPSSTQFHRSSKPTRLKSHSITRVNLSSTKIKYWLSRPKLTTSSLRLKAKRSQPKRVMLSARPSSVRNRCRRKRTWFVRKRQILSWWRLRLRSTTRTCLQSRRK